MGPLGPFSPLPLMHRVLCIRGAWFGGFGSDLRRYTEPAT